ncbi:UNVERIFIED_CONTAM: hypothetical protein PYX00_007239 [Menopon gallinae]|uniref:Uncharacterized protein n=1 Tax=Menopon gallinae TaxID=328185 RepID=A0AAW2HI67_9NEOP
MLLLLTSVVTLAACCLSAPFSRTFIFYYDIADINAQPTSTYSAAETGLATVGAAEDLFPDFEPPLTESGTYAPPPPPPPVQQPAPVPGPAVYPPVFGQLPTFFPYGIHGFSYFSYVAPGFQFFFMFM